MVNDGDVPKQQTNHSGLINPGMQDIPAVKKRSHGTRKSTAPGQQQKTCSGPRKLTKQRPCVLSTRGNLFRLAALSTVRDCGARWGKMEYLKLCGRKSTEDVTLTTHSHRNSFGLGFGMWEFLRPDPYRPAEASFLMNTCIPSMCAEIHEVQSAAQNDDKKDIRTAANTLNTGHLKPNLTEIDRQVCFKQK